MNSNVTAAFLLTALAGCSTGIGSAAAFFAKKTNAGFLSISLGFSAGVMIYVSMIEIFVKAKEALQQAMGEKKGAAVTVAAFFAGMLLIGLIGRLIPQKDNPCEFHKNEQVGDDAHIVPLIKDGNHALMRTGVFTALAIAIHNFPEGLATFVSAMQEPMLAVPVAAAIAIHNIPEGIAVSVPVFYATGSKTKALLYSFASGLSEPIGALIGYFLLRPFMSGVMYGVLFAGVAGIMVFISLDELLPAAREYGEHHLSIYGLVVGMAVMAISLLLFM